MPQQPTPRPRDAIAKDAARKLAAAAPNLKDLKATVGLDGFVDEIIGVVDKRHSLESYDKIGTIAHLGRRISDAAGESTNFELVVKQMKLGGNGPIMANALAAAGVGVTYVGMVGEPTIHPVFQEMAERAEVISIGEPGHTDALEFDDGKLMFGKYTSQTSAVTWDAIERHVGLDRWSRLMDASTLVGMVNWVMLPHMTRIWEQMIRTGLPNRTGKRRTLFIDLCDPEKRTHADILEAMETLTRFQEQVDVILGLNLKESSSIAEVIGVPVSGEPEPQIETTAARIRERLKLSCVVVHPRRGAAAATADDTARFAGPFVAEPMISTGAGDHFNAGFALGRVLGMALDESLCTGTATSGYYVRTAQSPSAAQLAHFMETLPPPQAS